MRGKHYLNLLGNSPAGLCVFQGWRDDFYKELVLQDKPEIPTVGILLYWKIMDGQI
ncbi:hypothetical protein [Salegentibacter salinarum]|uniref:hypothetical protein n=1 Tax=Salegentibacter salinarum TaxID=447422 RepID=UPI0012FF4B58|nr:hypothetical protein [Salegentibacter salinarum]